MAWKEKSTKDAAAVKVLTIISLIYLPTTIVAVSVIALPNDLSLLIMYRLFFQLNLYILTM
jgi:hypothetical protein